MGQPRELSAVEEEEVLEIHPATPGPAPGGGPSVVGYTSSEEGSTPGSGDALTRRYLQRVKRRFVNMSEHLRCSITDTRQSLSETRTEFWEAIEDATQERTQLVPTFQRLLDTRIEMLSESFRAGLQALKEELNEFLTPHSGPSGHPSVHSRTRGRKRPTGHGRATSSPATRSIRLERLVARGVRGFPRAEGSG
ncbi:hypothetical protein N9L68_00320 [bacterium]|nr:hypothetical protein [bacterium]